MIASSGGTTNAVIDFKSAGFISTGELCRRLGFGNGVMSASWIVQELGVKPSIVIRNGQSFYWSRESVRAARDALVVRLVKLDLQAADS